ncbi:MAG: hypothetical protein K2O18_03255, partial [Oscillospiraceae bacterium]|nr:hypothetical protein [Oscillospiraceae bacterium]
TVPKEDLERLSDGVTPKVVVVFGFAPVESDELAEARAAAVEDVNGYKVPAIDELDADKAAEAAAAKDTALAAIAEAEDQDAIDAAVAAYKEAIDGLTETTPAPAVKTASVSISYDQSGAAVEKLQVKNENGKWVDSYVATVDANGQITITAKCNPTNSSSTNPQSPYVIGNSAVAFTGGRTSGTWTATATVTSEGQSFVLDVKDSIDMKATVAGNVKVINVKADSKSEYVVPAIAYTENGTSYHGPATYVVTVPAGSVPRVSAVTSEGTTPLTEGTGYTVTYTPVEGSADTWMVTLDKLVGATAPTCTIGATTAPQLVLEAGDPNISLNGKNMYDASSGKAVVTVYVKGEGQPVFTGAVVKTDKVTKLATSDLEGYSCWTAEISGIKYTVHMTVEIEATKVMTVKNNDAAAAKELVFADLNSASTRTFAVENGKATFNVLTAANKKPAFIGDTDVTDGGVFDEEQTVITRMGTVKYDGKDWTEWKIELGGLAPTGGDASKFNYEVEARPTFIVEILHAPGAKFTPDDLLVYADADAVAANSYTITAKLNVEKGYVPVDAGVTPDIALTSVSVDDPANNVWKIEETVTKSGRMVVKTLPLPAVTLAVSGTTEISGRTEVMAENGDYIVTIPFNVMPGFQIPANAKCVATESDGATSFASIITSGPYQKGDHWEVMAKVPYTTYTTELGGTSEQNVILTFETKASHTVTVNLAEGSGLTFGKGTSETNSVADGGNIDLNVVVPAGMSLVVETTPATKYTVKGADGPVIVSLTGVKQDVTVDLSVKEYSDATRTFVITNNNATELNATQNTTIADETFGTFSDGGKEWVLTKVVAGYVPSVTAYKAHSTHTPANEVALSENNLKIEYTTEAEAADTITTTDWTITMSDIDQSLDLVFEAKPIVTGNRENKYVLDTAGQVNNLIEVAVEDPTACTKEIVGAIGVTITAGSIDEDAETYSIYVFVLEGYALADTGDVSGMGTACKAAPAASLESDVPSSISVPDGYAVYKITVEKDSATLDTIAGKITFEIKVAE